MDVERQLFANMHLSSCEALISGLMHKNVDPNSINCMIAYGTILKPGSNLVALYKSVAPFNKNTYNYTGRFHDKDNSLALCF